MIQSVSISGVLTLNLHSLNNEGTEGNVQMTRTVQIVDRDRSVQSVNAVSGDMFKHAQAEYFRTIAVEEKLPLCPPSARGDANRINADDAFKKLLAENPGGQGKPPKLAGSVVLDRILERCALTDCEGTLVVAEGYSVPRKSCVEFGWIVGRPESTRTDSFLHVKYDPEGRGKSTGEDDNAGQALFHRPANSGEYAATVHLELGRVGRNDITLKTIDETERRKRMAALVRSVIYTFVRPNGAQHNTQLPHVMGFEGVITTSTTAVPAPALSALQPSFAAQLMLVTEALNALSADSVAVLQFRDMGEFVGHMNGIVKGLQG